MGLTVSWYTRMTPINSWRIDLPSLRDALPMLLEAASQILGGSHARCLSCRHRDVDRRQRVLVQAKGFSRQPLDTVAGHGVAEGPGRNRQTEARMTLMICQH